MNTTTAASGLRAALTAAGIGHASVSATNGRVTVATDPRDAKAAWIALRVFARANGLKMATHRGYSIWRSEYGTLLICGATWKISAEEQLLVLRGLGESVAA